MTDSEILRHAAKILERETNRPNSLSMRLVKRILYDLAYRLDDQ